MCSPSLWEFVPLASHFLSSLFSSFPRALLQDATLRISNQRPLSNIRSSVQIPQPGGENGHPPGRYRSARRGNPNPHWVISNWLGLMESECRESCRTEQRRGPSAPEDNNVPFPNHEQFLTYITPTIRGRKRTPPKADTAPQGMGTLTPLNSQV